MIRKTYGQGSSSRSSAPWALARLLARISVLMPAEPQNVVAVISAMTTRTPGASAAASCSPRAPALAMSISAGRVTTGAWAVVTGAVSAMAVTSKGPKGRDPGSGLGAGEPIQDRGWLVNRSHVVCPGQGTGHVRD